MIIDRGGPIIPIQSLVKPESLPENVDVKYQICMSDTYAADGTLLEWMSLSESSSSDSSSDSEAEMVESIQVSDTDVGLTKSTNVGNLTKMFELNSFEKRMIETKKALTGKNENVRNLAGYFGRKNSNPDASQADSGLGASQSSTSFEGSIHSEIDFGSRGRAARRSYSSSTSRSKSRMERGAERAKAKLEKLRQSLNNPTPTHSHKTKRSRSIDPLNDNLSTELRKVESREKTRKEPGRSLSTTRLGKRDNNDFGVRSSHADAEDKIKVNVDKTKNEISLTLSPQLGLETIANLDSLSKSTSPKPVKKLPTETSEKKITVTKRKDGNGQTITLEQTITKKKPKTPKTGFGAQATNKPLRKINLSNSTPYCFEVIHKRTNKQISNLHICPSEEFQNRIKLMVEMNHMRYYALFYPTQKMEHIKTLVYVLTGVMPRLQEVYYRQLMESKLPFEDLISGNADDVLRTKNVLQRHMNLGLLTRSDRLMSLDDSMLGESISGSIQSSSQPDMSDATWHHRTSSFHSEQSDEAYGSDKSGII